MNAKMSRFAELANRISSNIDGHIAIRVQTGEDPKELCEEVFRSFLSLEVTVYDPTGDHILAMR